ncbi:hypothetical protein [Crenobacter luteus]|uniref:Uncharacterized protein n=1 Tax=Crenobacter luteus TaxID=1452487 RepID=A0A163CNF4_9NEIS|nr:hypothetical protein [Crenobacter luteus]KZE32841.1 hypothetical protein AVW16_10680 [Crenobacter luteus]
MKTVRLVLKTMALLWAVPAWAVGCPPEAWMCASPGSGFSPDASSMVQKESPLLIGGGGRFALEKIDDGSRFGLRPSFRLGENGRLSLRVGKAKTELRMKWTY